MSDIMLDLETMGTTPNSAIIAIGAVEFDIHNNTIRDKFYTTVDLDSSVKNCGIIDASTVLWWMKQSDESRIELTKNNVDIKTALFSLSIWIKSTGILEETRIWGNGASFDNVILSSAYKNNDIQQPWKFYNDRCYRTIKSMYPDIILHRIGAHHHALNDAESQAIHLMEILNHTKGTK
jgi:exodeoxyribonuclease VIII